MGYVKAPWAVAILFLAGWTATLLSGCASSPPPSAPQELGTLDTETGKAAAEAAQQGYEPNLWLLDAARPVGSTVSSGAEPSILVDREGRLIWVGDTSGAYSSRDNGTSWQPTASYRADIGVAFGDGVALAQDDTGRLYAAFLNDNRVDVVASTDGGASWDTMGIGAGLSGVADRPWLAADGDGEVVLFYFDAPLVAVGLWEHCARSTDGGQTFVDRDPVSITPGKGGKAFFDSAGRFYLAHNSGSAYRYDTTCAGSTRAIPILSDTEGANNLLQGAADGTDLYMVGTNAAGKIILGGSRDGGPARQVTVSPAFLPANTFSTVAARDGVVAVSWYGSESGGDPSSTSFNGAFNVYVALVRGFWGETTVEYYRLTAEPNHVGDICMGGIGCTTGDRDLLDYFMVDLDLWGGVHVAYGHDGSGSASTVRYARIPPGLPGVALDMPANVIELPEEEDPPAPAADGVSPTASFTSKARGYRVNVDASNSEDPQGSAMTYAWTWGDGSTSSGRLANHTYARHGAFAITLQVTDPDGNVGTLSRNVLVDGSGNKPPTPRITVSPAQPVAGQPITLRDVSTDPDGKVVARSWTVGSKRGDDATLQVTLAAGTHVVKLTVTDDAGTSASTTVNVKVVASADAGQPNGAGGDEPAVTIKVPGPGFALLAAALALAAVRHSRRR